MILAIAPNAVLPRYHNYTHARVQIDFDANVNYQEKILDAGKVTANL